MRKQFLLTLMFLFITSQAQAQVLYLSPYRGDGSDANPFRCDDGPGTECKSLRADETRQSGYGLASGPSVPARPGVIDLNGKRPIVKADRDKILAERGIAITATTFDDLVSELVDSQGVSLKRKDGRQRIVIKGQEVWSRPAPLASYLPDVWQVVKNIFAVPVAWAATSLSEDWNCADDTTPNYICDHIWVRYQGVVAEMTSNSLRTINSALLQLLYSTSTLDSTDMSHRVTVTSIARGTATTIKGGATARHAGTSGGDYVFCTLTDAASQLVEYGHLVGGALTTDGTVSATVANGDTVEVQAVGDQLSCKHNGTTVLGPITENTGNGNTQIGVRFTGSGTGTTTTVVLDDSFAQVVTASFGPLRRRHQ